MGGYILSDTNKNRAEEQHRVDDVIQEIKEKQDILLEKTGILKGDVIDLKETFFDDVTVNLDDPDEVIETHASIKQQAELVSERERSYGIIDKELNVLNKLKDNPYFGRIDFQENEESKSDKIYIGIASLMDNKDEDFLIYDWRAPISSLYYDYQPGEAQFETESGTISGDMLLKRQFVIEDGIIEGLFDTGITIGDGLLQRALGNNASSTMQSIVATIQREQNKIIRDEKHKYLIVQGVAGSGKTSAALQRVAYLMYRYRDILNEDNIVLFSPNPLFNSYVANVLPELGEANMRQTTFLEYVIQKVEKERGIETPSEQMEFMLNNHGTNNEQFRLDNMAYKSSLAYKCVLDDFITYLQKTGIVFNAILFRGNVLIAKKEVEMFFYNLVNVTSIPNALLKTQQWLLQRISEFRDEEVNKDWVMDEVELMDEEAYLEAAQIAQKQEEIDDFYDSGLEEDILREKIIDQAFSPIEANINSSTFINIFTTYKTLFTTFESSVLPHNWSDICDHTIKQLDHHYLNWEDVTPYVYFKENLLGENTDRSVRYLFIDEAQDYTPFQLAYIKHIFPHTRMTFLGDINQAILAHTADGNPLQAEYKESYERIELTKSYRSTKQIVEFTKAFSPSGDKIIPFDREGDKTELMLVENKEMRNNQLVKRANNLLNKGHGTVAIICKSALETEQLHHELKNKISLHKMDEQTRTLEKGVLILPIYLAKGIEFDAVIIPNASDQQYGTEFERTLFYTACTRAMHALAIFSEGKPTPFIKEVPKEVYNINHIFN